MDMDSKKITGAGILIIEKYKNMNCYVLFRGRKTGQYQEPGGFRDAGEDAKDTACRECREETANLFTFNKKKLSYFITFNNQYITFVIYIKGLQLKKYFDNIKLVHAKCDYHWKETDDIVRVPLQNINPDTFPKTIDINGNEITLRGRTRDILRIASRVVNTVLSSTPRKLKQIKKNNDNQCLLRTSSFTF